MRSTEKSAWTLAREIGVPIVREVGPDAPPPSAPLIELAWDGLTVLACRTGDDARIFDADLRDWSQPFAAIAIALRRLALRDVVLLGHVCVLDERSRPTFDGLRRWVGGERDGTLVLAVGDVARIDDDDLRSEPLQIRRERLAELLTDAPPALVLSQPLAGSLPEVRASVARLGLPGIWIRELESTYPTRDTSTWTATSATDAPLPPRRALSPSPKVTNADKVLYPRDGITKTDIAAYYADIAPVLLAHMAGRPIVGQRWPDGIDEFTWYQHRVPPRAPDYLRPVFIDGDRRIVIESRDALLWLVNQAALTFHGWTSRVSSLDAPDWVVLDLDPGTSTTWDQVIAVALALRKLLELLEVPSVVKTSGKKGLHVLVPLAPGQTMALAQSFADKVARLLVRLMPDVVTTETEIEKRGGRLYFDHGNFRAKSLVLPYSLRDADGATVSTPLAWDEVGPKLDPKAFTWKTLRARLDAKGDLFASVLQGRCALAPVLAKMG